MPRLTVSLLEGRDLETKRTLAKRLVEAVTETLNVPPSAVSIAFDEYRKDQLVIGGVLACDKEPQKVETK